MAVRTLRLRYPSSCAACAAPIPRGATASWDDEGRQATCASCAGAVAPPDSGEAGRSAAREYDKRSARERARKEAAIAKDRDWRETITSEKPVLGRLAAALTPRPQMTPESQATTAWRQGAAGERRVAEVLASCPTVHALHDRRIPGSKANIDHLVVGPAGVFVVDAKRYVGDVEARDKGSWLRADVRLYVAGRDRTKLVSGVEWQLEHVRAALTSAAIDAPTAGILCFVGAMWPRFFRKPLQFGAVTALWPDALGTAVSAAGPLDADAVERIARALAVKLPVA